MMWWGSACGVIGRRLIVIDFEPMKQQVQKGLACDGIMKIIPVSLIVAD